MLAACALDIPTVCLLGSPGAGKSSTCNTLFRCRTNGSFKVEHGTSSPTLEPEVQVLPWRGLGPPVRCVDLPGLGTSRWEAGGEALKVASMLQKEVQNVHAFLLVLNGAAPRLDTHLIKMLAGFKSMLGEAFFNRAMIVFTHWDFSRSAEKRRLRLGQSKNRKADMTNKEFRKLLGQGFEVPCVFIDNSLNSSSDADLEDEYGVDLPDIMREFEAEIQKVYSFVTGREPLLSMDIGTQPKVQKPIAAYPSLLSWRCKDMLRREESHQRKSQATCWLRCPATRSPSTQNRELPPDDPASATWYWTCMPL